MEVSTIGATFCIVLTDAGNFPPPFRIDNFSEVPISYVQSGANDESLRLTVKPHQSVPYALVRNINHRPSRMGLHQLHMVVLVPHVFLEIPITTITRAYPKFRLLGGVARIIFLSTWRR